MTHERLQSRGEELLNALTHGSGLGASIVALPVLVMVATAGGDSLRIIACTVFAATLVLLYAASTLYHAIPASRAKQVLRVVDHSSIYLLIAGSYTPFTLGVLRGAWGWSLFAVVWTLAACGILYKTILGFRFPRLSTGFYLAMGWLAVVALEPLARALPGPALAWLLAGGLCYTAGVPFYARDRLRFRHAVWHLFVLAGSACHYVAVLLYAARPLR